MNWTYRRRETRRAGENRPCGGYILTVNVGSSSVRLANYVSQPAALHPRGQMYLGAYLAVLGGADTILFGGGVGDNAPSVRSLILTEFSWAGLLVDHPVNTGTIGREA